MNILHAVPALESGGVETGTVDLALSLKKLGENVTVVSSGGRMVKRLEENGIPHIKMPVHTKSPAIVFVAWNFASVLKKYKIDIVHASSRVPALIAYMACKITNTCFVTSCHGFYSKSPFSYVMGKGKLVMVISRAVGERMRELFNVSPEKIRLVYRGIDISRYPYRPEKAKEDKEHFTVINIGRITPVKGYNEFIKAMKIVLERNRNVEAQIVGGASKGKEAYLSSLRELAKSLGIEKHVRFLGLRADISDLLNKADLLVLSSNIPEGFGRTIIEAGATGTPVCASSAGGIKEIVEDGVSGLLFPPGDEKNMAEAILRMFSNRALRTGCAAALRKKVEADFTLDKMARQTLAVYREALTK